MKALWLGFCSLSLLLAGCGGEEDAPPPKPADSKPAGAAPKPAAAPTRGGAGAAAAGKAATLQVYGRVEDFVPEGERETIRHRFRDRDFVPDNTGSESRDPFLSFVISQPGLINDTPGNTVADENCSKKQLVATKYSMRELRLVGIVTRGTRRFALFQDPKDTGHISTRGDCLGKEKARIKDIGAGFVTLEMVAETAPGQPPRPAEERSIPLYPEELQITEETEEDPNLAAPPSGLPTPSMAPPMVPQVAPPAESGQ